MRYHAATAVNLSLTAPLYACAARSSAACSCWTTSPSPSSSGSRVGFALWLTMLRYLIRGVIAARRGEKNEVPGWICARIVRLGLGQLARHRVGQQPARVVSASRPAS